jgi:uncharacterized protein YjbJ (UPF0337 family)
MTTPKDPYDPIVSPIQAAAGQSKYSDDKSRGDKSSKENSGTSQQSGQHHAQQAQKKSAPNDKSVNQKSDGKQPTKSPQQQASPTADRLEGKWHQFVGAAKTTWGKLTDDEILQSEGNAQKLAGLVEERYALSRDIADTQVKKFLDNCRSK